MHFGAVDYRAVVWVNGEVVTRHEGGHTPFSADISRVVREHDNVVVVRAEDPLTDKTIPRGKQHWTETSESIFYTATTGVWQTVWLEPLPARAIESLRIKLVRDAFVDMEYGLKLQAQGDSAFLNTNVSQLAQDIYTYDANPATWAALRKTLGQKIK